MDVAKVLKELEKNIGHVPDDLPFLSPMPICHKCTSQKYEPGSTIKESCIHIAACKRAYHLGHFDGVTESMESGKDQDKDSKKYQEGDT